MLTEKLEPEPAGVSTYKLPIPPRKKLVWLEKPELCVLPNARLPVDERRSFSVPSPYNLIALGLKSAHFFQVTVCPAVTEAPDP